MLDRVQQIGFVRVLRQRGHEQWPVEQARSLISGAWADDEHIGDFVALAVGAFTADKSQRANDNLLPIHPAVGRALLQGCVDVLVASFINAGFAAHLVLQRLQGQLGAQMTRVERLSAQRFSRVIQQLALDQCRVDRADIDLGHEFFQVGGCHPGGHRVAVFVLHRLVAQRNGYQVLQCQFDQRQRNGLRLAGDHESAQHDEAGDADLNVFQIQVRCRWMILDHLLSQGLQGKFRQ
ncbi:hypothetical protein D3C84_583580 [compost metagenome]